MPRALDLMRRQRSRVAVLLILTKLQQGCSAMGRKTVTRTLADGTVKTYSYARSKDEARARTVASVAREYIASPQYRGLKPNSQKLYDRFLNSIVAEYGEVEIVKIKRRHVLTHRDAMADTPAMANEVHKVWTVLLSFAVEREYIPYHPALRIKKLPISEHARWPEGLVEKALTPGALPEHLRRAVVIAVYTGQREGDCIRMLWSDYDGSVISLVQQKTGKRLVVPCHSALRAELDAWKAAANSTHILVRPDGTPWRRADLFSASFGQYVRRRNSDGALLRPEFDGFVFHGLRKVAAARLAEAGCSIHEIAAITGHSTLSMLEFYTRESDQRKRASAAITKLENWRNGK